MRWNWGLRVKLLNRPLLASNSPRCSWLVAANGALGGSKDMKGSAYLRCRLEAHKRATAGRDSGWSDSSLHGASA